jgi:hypothetical protein
MYYRIVPAVYSCLFIKARVNYLASDVPDRLSPPNCNPNNFSGGGVITSGTGRSRRAGFRPVPRAHLSFGSRQPGWASTREYTVVVCPTTPHFGRGGKVACPRTAAPVVAQADHSRERRAPPRGAGEQFTSQSFSPPNCNPNNFLRRRARARLAPTQESALRCSDGRVGLSTVHLLQSASPSAVRDVRPDAA